MVFVRSRIIAHSLGSAWRGGLCANIFEVRSRVILRSGSTLLVILKPPGAIALTMAHDVDAMRDAPILTGSLRQTFIDGRSSAAED